MLTRIDFKSVQHTFGSTTGSSETLNPDSVDPRLVESPPKLPMHSLQHLVSVDVQENALIRTFSKARYLLDRTQKTKVRQHEAAMTLLELFQCFEMLACDLFTSHSMDYGMTLLDISLRSFWPYASDSPSLRLQRSSRQILNEECLWIELHGTHQNYPWLSTYQWVWRFLRHEFTDACMEEYQQLFCCLMLNFIVFYELIDLDVNRPNGFFVAWSWYVDPSTSDAD